MDLTITFGEPIAERLRKRASARRQSPEQIARELLDGALSRIADEEAWDESNRRRAELIVQSRVRGLTKDEGEELDRLQAELDQRLAPIDGRLLDVAEEFRRLAENLPDAPAS